MSVRINGTTGVTTPNLTATTKVTTADLANTGNYNGGQLGNRNLIINGAQTIDQRRNGSSVSIPSVTTVVTDRWNPINRPSAGGLMSGQQVTDSPAGFSNSLKLTVSTADSSLGTSDYYFLWQKIEGFNSAHLSYGTSDAVSTTLSFWVKSSVAGQYSGFIINGAENYSCNIPYTIESAGTWEYKTITFPGAPAGTWIGSTNGKAMMVGFGLANGTGLQSSTTSWQATGKYGSSGDVNWMASSGNTFQVTGIQFEVGDSATPFEHRSYGQELSLCQRYYQNIQCKDTNGAVELSRNRSSHNEYSGTVFGMSKMRTEPTMSQTDMDRLHKPGIVYDTVSSVSFNGHPDGASARVNLVPTTDHTNCLLGWYGANSGGSINFDAEL